MLWGKTKAIGWSLTSRKKDKWRCQDLPGSSVVKNPPANAGDTGSVPELGRSPEGGNGNPF